MFHDELPIDSKGPVVYKSTLHNYEVKVVNNYINVSLTEQSSELRPGQSQVNQSNLLSSNTSIIINYSIILQNNPVNWSMMGLYVLR